MLPLHHVNVFRAQLEFRRLTFLTLTGLAYNFCLVSVNGDDRKLRRKQEKGEGFRDLDGELCILSWEVKTIPNGPCNESVKKLDGTRKQTAQFQWVPNDRHARSG